MELAIFLKMLFDSSAFLVICGFIMSLFLPVSHLSLSAVFLSLAAGGCYLTREKTGISRRLPLLIAAIGFIFAKTAGDICLLALLSAYLVYIEEKQIYMNDDDDFKSQFQKVFFASVLPCLFAAVSSHLDTLNEILLPYMFVMIVCGIALLRILRHNKEIIDSRAFKLSNILAVAAVCLMTLVLSSHTFLASVGSALSFVYNKVLINLFAVFIFSMARFLSLFSKLFAMIFNKEVKFYEKGDPAPAGGKDVSFEDEVIGEVPDFIIYLFFGLLAAAVIFLLFIGLKALAGKNRRFDRHSDYTMERNTIEIQKESRRNPFASKDEREAVRHQYRKFLKECLERGFKIKKDFDTEQISEGASDYFPGAPLEDLRSIYIRARYTDGDISREDAKNAKELCSAIKKTSLSKEEKERLEKR